MIALNQGIDDAIDVAVLKIYPAYAEAANISGLIGDLAVGIIDFFDTYGMRSGDSYAWKPAITDEIYAVAIADAEELSDCAMLARRAINSSTDAALAIVRSKFAEDLKIYYNSCHLLEEFLRTGPNATS